MGPELHFLNAPLRKRLMGPSVLFFIEKCTVSTTCKNVESLCIESPRSLILYLTTNGASETAHGLGFKVRIRVGGRVRIVLGFKLVLGD